MRTNVIPKKNKTSFGTIFMRVSFRDQDYPTDRKDAFRKLEYCMKRAESWLGYRLQYHRVLEQGEQTNRWHFHVVIYNAPYASFEQWQENAFIYGTVNVRTVYDVAGLGKYCTKISRYITKGDEVLPRYAKAYAPSLRLKKPIDYYELSDTLPILFQRFKEHALVVQETKWLPNTYYLHDTLKYELWQTGT
jgi:hypothetical protein